MSRIIKFLATLTVGIVTGALGLYLGLLLSARFFCADRPSGIIVTTSICAIDWQTALLTVILGVILFVFGFVFSFKLLTRLMK